MPRALASIRRSASTLATEDLEFRRKNDGRLLEKLFSVNVYFKAYAKMALDQYAELERWRRKGREPRRLRLRPQK